MEKLTLLVERVPYPPHPETGWCSLKCYDRNTRTEVSVVGCITFTPKPMQTVIFTGKWGRHPKYGKQFEFDFAEETMPESILEIQKFLIKEIKGIGKSTAKKIVKKYGTTTFWVLDSNINDLLKIKGMSEGRLAQIKDSWDTVKKKKKTVASLVEMGIDPTISAKIFKKYGEDSIEIVKRNPYQLIDDLYGVGFITADRIAMRIGIEKNSFFRIRAGIKYSLEENANNGHCYMVMEPLLKRAVEFLDVDEENVVMTIDNLRHQKELIILNQTDVFLPKYYYAEAKTAGRIQDILQDRSEEIDKTRIMQFFKDDQYDDTQLEAICQAIQNPVFILTGSPGTGKTHTLNGMIRYMKNVMHYKVLLAAPTGKAAKRMEELTHESACTIHRLLECNRLGQFERNEYNPIYGDALIVDESSMIDSLLMSALIRAVPDGMKLIFVGDADQLPSVGAGNVLADMLESGIIPSVKLTTLHRQSGDGLIAQNAQSINQNNQIRYDNRDPSEFMYFDQTACSDEEIAEKIVLCVTDRLKHFDKLTIKDVQVLLPMKKGPLGTIEMNRRLQNALNPCRSEDSVIRLKNGQEFRVGDRVMQIVNNYDKDVFNGDTGFIEWIDTDTEHICVMFDDKKEVEYEKLELEELMLAYAITIHKSQGSEYPIVVTAFTKSQWMMLYRRLLYTCVTRARNHIYVYDKNGAIGIAKRRNEDSKRNTYLKRMLTGEA